MVLSMRLINAAAGCSNKLLFPEENYIESGRAWAVTAGRTAW
jgi:hypothetical protein